MTKYQLGLLTTFCVVIFLFFFPETAREFIRDASIYWTFSIILAGSTIGYLRFMYLSETRRAYAVLFGQAMITFLLLALLAEPNRMYSRAGARLVAAEQIEGTTYPGRWATEYNARRLEYEAAEIRRSGDPEYFHSRYTSYSFLLLALFAGLAMTEALRPEWQYFRKSGHSSD